ncbi:MAG: LuxR C-terminal-related transcriptional regulator [Gammaproteobacteria bacterium]|nr:LuxR C-terminal-related transcriptional regulator [Gammaproteobacteria bacterium]
MKRPVDGDSRSAADTGSGSGRQPSLRQDSRAEHSENGPPPWLLRHRIAVPDRVPAYFHRKELEEKCTPNRQQITLLMAPGGFGKTTLLAECARAATDFGMPAAWVSMEAQDEPAQLETYLVYAFELAGLNVLELFRSEGPAAMQPHTRADVLIGAIESYGKPCLLALDELERVQNPESVAILNSLISRGPPELHIAISCRELPVGLDVTASVLGRDAVILTSEDLRFSRPEIARFFVLKLSRQELADVEAESKGWPIALQIRRNKHGSTANDESLAVRHVVENWLESRLWYSFSEKDRDLVLDVGLFDWFDTELLHAVLEDPEAIGRLNAMIGLAGLMQPLAGGRAGMRCLHPLIKDQCARQLQREAPERYQSINRRIATALSKRGDVVSAVRYATKAADKTLLRTVFVEAGGVRLMLRQGVDRLLAIDAHLTEELVALDPRLGFARTVCLICRGRLTDARRTYETAARASVDQGLGDDPEVRLDQLFTRASLAYFGSESMVALETLIQSADYLGAGEDSSNDPAMDSLVTFGLCYIHTSRAEFESGEIHEVRLRNRVDDRAPYLATVSALLFGETAMAQGRVGDAAREYHGALRLATERFLGDPRVVVRCSVLKQELDLERNRFEDDAEAIRLLTEVRRMGGPFSSFAAATEAGVELALKAHGPARALSMVEEMLHHAQRAEMPMLARHLAALRVSTLAVLGGVEEANRFWRACGLPEDDAGCLDLRGQTWREMEALSCARLRLDIASDRFDEGRQIGRGLIEAASRRGLQRTQMRGLALMTGLEAQSGDWRAALTNLERFLKLFVKIDYARPIVREGEQGVAVLKAFRNANPNSPLANRAESILAALLNARVLAVPNLSPRESEVLWRLESQRDKEIASSLGISIHGVRYHVGNILDKLNARNRFDAARRARIAGLLDPDD